MSKTKKSITRVEKEKILKALDEASERIPKKPEIKEEIKEIKEKEIIIPTNIFTQESRVDWQDEKIVIPMYVRPDQPVHPDYKPRYELIQGHVRQRDSIYVGGVIIIVTDEKKKKTMYIGDTHPAWWYVGRLKIKLGFGHPNHQIREYHEPPITLLWRVAYPIVTTEKWFELVNSVERRTYHIENVKWYLPIGWYAEVCFAGETNMMFKPSHEELETCISQTIIVCDIITDIEEKVVTPETFPEYIKNVKNLQPYYFIEVDWSEIKWQIPFYEREEYIKEEAEKAAILKLQKEKEEAEAEAKLLQKRIFLWGKDGRRNPPL